MAEFKLGRLKFVWKGPWAAGQSYYKDDVVSSGGVSYICINAHTSGSTLAGQSVNWQKMAGGTNFTGAWANTGSALTGQATYFLGDLITQNGNVYICTTAHTPSSTWLTDISNWAIYSQGVSYRGVWLANAQYYLNDLVKQGANIYLCSTANNDAAFTPTRWQLFVQGLEFQNSWSNSTTYNIGDVITFGGYVYSAVSININQKPSTTSAYWSVVTTGYSNGGTWNILTEYQTGAVVQFGGWTYVANLSSTGQQPFIGTSGINTTYWSLLVQGFNHRGNYFGSVATSGASGNGSTVTITFANQTAAPFAIGNNIVISGVTPTAYNGTFVVTACTTNSVSYASTATGSQTVAGTVAAIYYPGDVVLIVSSTYSAKAVSSTITPPNATYWQIIGQGGVGASLTQTGDLAYRYPDGTVSGLHMTSGTQAGTQVVDGYVLKALNQGDGSMQPRWGELGYIQNIWYVSSTNGVDNAGLNYGRTLDKPFASIKYACTQVLAAGNPATIFVKTGTYLEQLPIRVPANCSIVGDELRTTLVGPASGISDDTITPNNRSRMFLVNNGCVIRNLTMIGLTGQFTNSTYIPNDPQGIYRLTVGTWPSATASGAYVALDPTGQITSKSPYVQNCSSFGDHAVGLYINGADQGRTGNISMVSNDFTQVIDNGIGVMAQNGGRAELVSVFTYYSYIGYLAQSGGVLRCANCNNSYGSYGDVATDIDPTDNGYSGAVNNLTGQANSGQILVGNGQVLAVYWLYQGQNYTAPTLTLDAAPANGTNASITANVANGVLSHINVTAPGTNYQFVSGTGRAGGTSSSGTWFALAATDRATTNNQYQGMRITIVNGTGAGQTAIITNSYLIDAPSGSAKVVYVQTTAGAQGWESLTGAGIVTVLDPSSQYTILPEVTAIGGVTSAAQNWINIAYGAGTWVAISGYTSASTLAVSSTNGINWTANTLPTSANWTSVAYGGGRFVAIAQGGQTAYSTNGSTWVSSNSVTMTGANGGPNWQNIRYGGGTFLALNSGAISNQAAATSPDGVTWTLQSLPSSATWIDSAYSAGNWVVISGGATPSTSFALASLSGATWTNTAVVASASAQWFAVASNGTTWVSIAANGATSYSTTGSTWTSGTNLSTLGFNGTWRDVVYDATAGQFVAVAQAASGASYSAYSTNGQVWTLGGAMGSTNTNFYAIASNGLGTYVSIGLGSSTFAISTNYGQTWSIDATAPTTSAVLRAYIDSSTFQFNGVYIINGGSGYSTGNLPTFSVVDPVGSGATFTAQVLNGAISSVNYVSRGTGYVAITGSVGVSDTTGYANIAQTGYALNISGLSQSPRPGSIIIIAGQTANFLVVQTNSYATVNGITQANVTVGTAVSAANPLNQGATVTVYQKFSQIRLTGHDYLAIGTGNFASTAYPNVSTSSYVITNQHISQNNGRIFYTATDQDGNFSVGDLFRINQATGQATLNVASFNLAGLNSLQLGSTGATITQFSTDATLSGNSDSVVPTQKAIKSYVSSQLGSGSNSLTVNVLTAGKVYINNNVVSTTTGTGSDLILSPDTGGKVQLNQLTNYNYTYNQIAAQAYTNLANRDYVDQATREVVQALYTDANGNLFLVNDIGSTGVTFDGSIYTDYIYTTRNTTMLLNNATGNLQIAY